ncbi:L-threonine 3-dehydrogenase, mitochondrial-like [Dendronephthya gigantea]|uniref:L-threonine 3-dehydrogenase, mitochondrial-like n=1 Tax=Dendronephthya gigantea TaxID=151771 RepID=UPI00106C9B9F|nr:L-threonine 3-dehydrogenase, mitochondrial-like [Dendronephthya gigantea]
MLKFGALVRLSSHLKPVRQQNTITRFYSDEAPKILITGGLGQLGRGLAQLMRNKYGKESVILSDVVKASAEECEKGPFIYADILDYKNLQSIVVNNQITWLVHFSALLSAIGEKNVQEALKINVIGFHNVIELCRQYGLRLFCPSTIGAFGPETPKNPTPDVTLQRPTTIYGVSKVHVELLGEYYNYKYGLDFRSARYPGVISADTAPGGGTTDYAVHIYHEALRTGKYQIYLRPDSCMPMIYIDDCLRGTLELLECPEEKLKRRIYNMQGISFTPQELVESVQEVVPDLQVEYEVDPLRQSIADSWPDVLDDTNARNDWNWKPQYDLPKMTKTMLDILKPKYK